MHTTADKNFLNFYCTQTKLVKFFRLLKYCSELKYQISENILQKYRMSIAQTEVLRKALRHHSTGDKLLDLNMQFPNALSKYF